MFLEPGFGAQRAGWIEVICGPMFSGKTEELIRRTKRAEIAGQKVLIFKPAKDIRYGERQVVSHDQNARESIPVAKAKAILDHANGANVIGVDEAQFFDEDIIEVCQMLAIRGKRVIVTGLDMDYLGRPFGPIPALLAVAEYITKVHAICQHCGSLATHSYRISEEEGEVVLGAKDKYEPRCRICYNMGNILNFTSRVDQ